ncbi:MAG: PucR family transcriptional regulator [Jatrophihabitantaceae bacterium]|nr:PucR family transcriptional regulator [Jatrophihabitantaceae bacterium]
MSSPAPPFADIAAAAAADAGGTDVGLLGDFLPAVARAVAAGQRLGRLDLRRCRDLGKQAARDGVALRAIVDLYLSAAWRLWPTLPQVLTAAQDPQGVVRAGSIMLRATDDAAAEIAEGYQLARRDLVRSAAADRSDFVDALLSGGADIGTLVESAAGFGVDLAGPHAVAVLRADGALGDADGLTSVLEGSVVGRKGDAGALAAVRGGGVVIVFSAPDRAAIEQAVAQLTSVLPVNPRSADADADPTPVRLRRLAPIGAWRMGIGRPYVGPAGIRLSFAEAREALDLADRLELEAPVVDAAHLLVHRLLLRDETALRDLIEGLLRPLDAARGGARPLLDTLFAYFESGANTARTARRLHLSVRAVTYRLERVLELTGSDPDDPDDRFALHAAVLGAKLLGWPERPSPPRLDPL